MLTGDWQELLTPEESSIIHSCLVAVAYGPFVTENDVHALFELERDDLKSIANDWPESNAEDLYMAVWGALRYLTNFQHGQDELWSDFIEVSPEQVRFLLRKIYVASGHQARTAARMREHIGEQLDMFASMPTLDLASRTDQLAFYLKKASEHGVEPPAVFMKDDSPAER